MTTITILLFWVISSSPFFTSEKGCKVLLDNISASYEGECKKGLAEGTGTASGVDTYSGEFKKGLPHGMGRYIWKSGDYYSGDFVEGRREGYGELMVKRGDKKDSLVAGYWTKDIYIGSSSVAYAVKSMTNIKNILFEKKSDTGNDIYIVFQQEKKPVAADGLRLTNPQGIKAASEFDYAALRKVEFPFLGAKLEFRSRASNGVSIVECAAEFDIFEKGNWQVTVEIE